MQSRRVDDARRGCHIAPVSKPSVSVIITCFNLARYLGASIESVLEQEGGGPHQVIVVDDCSTDDSRAVAARYPVELLALPENGGVLKAMLAGIAQARGDIICLLDGDDLWEKGKLEAVTAAFAADPDLVFLTHDLCFIDSDDTLIERRSRVEEEMTRISEAEWPTSIRNGILEHTDYVWLGSAMSFRRSRADLDGFARFAEALPDPRNTYQDWPLATWLAALPGSKSGFLPKKLFRYRLHGSNHSGDARTPAKAARNYRRTANTLDAMTRIQHRFGQPPERVAMIARRQAISSALSDLYAGHRRWAALGRLLRNAGELRHMGSLAKDLARATALVTLGPDRAVRLLHGRN